MNSRCPVCGAPSPSEFEPCADCEHRMFGSAFNRCSMCGLDLAGTEDPCPDCRGAEGSLDHSLDGMTALGPWRGALREWLSILKYGGDSRMAARLAEALIETANTQWPALPVIPVPPRRASVRRDGGDTVSLLARGIKDAGADVLNLLIRKGRGTQKGLNRQDRIRGEHLRFQLKRGAHPPKAAILLDDVATTGATLRRCASLLKSSGAERIYALVVCRD